MSTPSLMDRVAHWNAARHERANPGCRCRCYGCKFHCGAHWLWLDRILRGRRV